MKFSKFNFAFSAVIALLPIAAVASTATPVSVVTFQGEVASQTCQAKINGKTNSIVLLPTVAAADLSSAGKTTGTTPFTIAISGCAASEKATKIGTKFLGYNVTPTGNLSNLANSNPAKNVSIQLTSSAASDRPVNLNGVTSVEGLTLAAGKTEASHQFGVQYYAEGVAEPGAVTAVAEYTLSYQ